MNVYRYPKLQSSSAGFQISLKFKDTPPYAMYPNHFHSCRQKEFKYVQQQQLLLPSNFCTALSQMEAPGFSLGKLPGAL